MEAAFCAYVWVEAKRARFAHTCGLKADPRARRKYVCGKQKRGPAAHLDEHDVELEAFEERPGEGAEQQVVQQAGDDAAADAVQRPVDAAHQDHFGQQQAEEHVLVDRRPIRLQGNHFDINNGRGPTWQVAEAETDLDGAEEGEQDEGQQ